MENDSSRRRAWLGCREEAAQRSGGQPSETRTTRTRAGGSLVGGGQLRSGGGGGESEGTEWPHLRQPQMGSSG
jgi:hypothetical protein